MTPDYVLFIGKKTLLTAIYVLLPILGSGLAIGLIVAIFQAITQIHEMTLTFIPKMAVMALVILLLMPWFLDVILTYTQDIFNQIILISR
ncbi:MAG: flagellar biosynthetic protein FliQ [Candidatus Marinimicrobia bacterium]|nr:flagellar biosynthetic protein FliQ [Candidatus Neomarinimicrobiota bacterium]RKY62148.1 MAG: flagellar biosynthetic protein FliQ [Candidatus Neomarinimicrobiota bacterium]